MRLAPNTRHAGMLLLGLDNAGKSSLLRHLSDEDVTLVTPTHGFQIKTLVTQGVKLNVWDMGGQRVGRYYWRQYFGEANVIIFVVDAADPLRIKEAHDELSQVLEEEKIAGLPLLVLANKQDLIGAMNPEEISILLDLTEMRGRRWHIQGCSTKTGVGVSDGIYWAVSQVKR